MAEIDITQGKKMQIDEKVTPNVVPASFTPDPQTFEVKPSAELRSQQQKLARGYVEGRINEIMIPVRKNKRQVGDEMVSFTEPELAAQQDLAYTYQVAQTMMGQSLADFAGSTPIDVLETNMPEIFERFVDLVLRDRYPERFEAPAPEADDEVPALADEPVEETEMITPPVPMQTLEDAIEGTEDVSPLELPEEDQVTTGDVLGKIAEDNAS